MDAPCESRGHDAPARSGRVFLPGDAFAGRYRIRRVVDDTGLMTRMYEAEQISTERRVALKVLLSRHLGRLEIRRAMESLGKRLAQVQHPSVVTVIEVGVEPDLVWFATEYLDGETARKQLTRQGKWPLEKAAIVVLQVARALAAAHEREVVHGDIKPENIYLMKSGHAKVTDFLTAQFLGAAGAEPSLQREFILATAEYIAPERVAGQNGQPSGPTVRSDVYSLGLVLLELLTGANPMLVGGASTPPELLVWRHIHAELVVPAEVPAPIARVIRKACAKDPRRRHASMDEFASDLQAACRRAEARRAVDSPASSLELDLVKAVAQGIALGVLVGSVAFGSALLTEHVMARYQIEPLGGRSP